MSELLLDLDLGLDQREFAENIQRSAIALLTVINDILDFSKVESGHLDIEEIRFSLPIVINEVAKILSYAAKQKSLDFKTRISSAIPHDLTVMGDPGRVRQIIINLLTNSIKFTHQGFVRFTVEKERESPEMIEIKFTVEDSGIGIEDEIRQKLFHPFSQGDPSTARRFGGTGLGLTICKHLVELMQGRIVLESQLGVGTTASFWIPFNKPQGTLGLQIDIESLPQRLQSDISVSCNSSDPEIADVPNSTTLMAEIMAEGRGIPPNPPTPTDPDELPISLRSKMLVLVVEDNQINQQIAIRTIKKLGFSVIAVWNGKEALEYLERSRNGQARKPDIILMDVQMPVIDGYRCTHVLRHQPPYKTFVQDIPIVAMTASAIQGDREKCTKAGMDDYLSKPVQAKTLERMLVRWSLQKGRYAMPTSSPAIEKVLDRQRPGSSIMNVRRAESTSINRYENCGSVVQLSPSLALSGSVYGRMPSLQMPNLDIEMIDSAGFFAQPILGQGPASSTLRTLNASSQTDPLEDAKSLSHKYESVGLSRNPQDDIECFTTESNIPGPQEDSNSITLKTRPQSHSPIPNMASVDDKMVLKQPKEM